MRYLSLLAKRVTAAAIVAVLTLAPLAPGLRALSGEPVKMCSRHGRDCPCPESCAEDKGSGHNHEATDSAAGPACHRKTGAGSPVSKPDCQMGGCGKEEQATYAVYQPAEPARAIVDRIAPPVLAASAYLASNRVPLDSSLPPPSPPPRS